MKGRRLKNCCNWSGVTARGKIHSLITETATGCRELPERGEESSIQREHLPEGFRLSEAASHFQLQQKTFVWEGDSRGKYKAVARRKLLRNSTKKLFVWMLPEVKPAEGVKVWEPSTRKAWWGNSLNSPVYFEQTLGKDSHPRPWAYKITNQVIAGQVNSQQRSSTVKAAEKARQARKRYHFISAIPFPHPGAFFPQAGKISERMHNAWPHQLPQTSHLVFVYLPLAPLPFGSLLFQFSAANLRQQEMVSRKRQAGIPKEK